MSDRNLDLGYKLFYIPPNFKSDYSINEMKRFITKHKGRYTRSFHDGSHIYGMIVDYRAGVNDLSDDFKAVLREKNIKLFRPSFVTSKYTCIKDFEIMFTIEVIDTHNREDYKAAGDLLSLTFSQ